MPIEQKVMCLVGERGELRELLLQAVILDVEEGEAAGELQLGGNTAEPFGVGCSNSILIQI